MQEKYRGSERRQSVRLSRTLAAKFMLINEETSTELTGMQTGSIRNISAGGALLEVGGLNEEWISSLVAGIIKVALEIEIPDTKDLIRSLTRVVWYSGIGKDEQTKKEKYILGLKFVDITTSSQDIIKEYVIKAYIE